eukprot:COSAG02_NODE_3204_length_7176_cov_1.990391_4_plen_79_part_00
MVSLGVEQTPFTHEQATAGFVRHRGLGIRLHCIVRTPSGSFGWTVMTYLLQENAIQIELEPASTISSRGHNQPVNTIV